MSVDRALLLRHLRQRRELGERELFLDELTAAELVGIVEALPVSPRAGTVATPAGRAFATSSIAPVGPGNVEPPDAAIPATSHPAGSAPGVGGAGREGLAVLGQEAAGCTRCRLHQGRRNVVFGEGNPVAEVVVVGEGPGAEEDRTGRPFVGPAGKLLDLLLLTAGLPREQVYICNVLKCRPPNNRDPEPDEIEACSAYLQRQLERIAPKVLLAAGRFAAQTLTGSAERIGKLRGRVHSYRGTPVVATFHPAFLLRSPAWTRAAWQDLQLVREILDA